MNPIENIWQILKSKLENKETYSKNDLIPSVLNIWNNDAYFREKCTNLILSMQRRVKALYDSKEHLTKY